jgi:hypothetical protein
VGLVLRPGDQPSSIAAVGEDMLDEGEAPSGPLQYALRAVAVLEVGSMDLDYEQPAVGVGQNVPLAAVDPLSGVIAL